MTLDRLGQKRRALSLCAALACSIGFAGPAAAQTDANLMVGVTSLTPHLDPMGIMANVNWRVSQNILETLIRFDYDTGELKPGLATSWERTAPTVLELTLREGVTCHNGEPFDAEDVEIMFGPERFLGKDAPGYPVARAQLGVLKAVEALDSRTVRFETNAPDPLLELRLANFMSEVPCADAYRAAGDWDSWGQAVVGTGPYKVAEARPGELQRFERFDGYWGDPAPVASFTLKMIPETGARIAGLLSGEYHIVTEVSPDQFDAISSNASTEIAGGAIQNILTVIYDTRHPVLSDPRIRRALNLAIDRDLIVESIFHGRTSVSKGFQMKSFGKMYIDDFKPVSYDPELARKLLEDAGYKGEEIVYWYLADYYTGEVTMAQILQQMWQDVGLNVSLEMKENWAQIGSPELAGERGITNSSNNAVYPDPIGQLYRNFGPDGQFVTEGYWTNDRFQSWGKDLLSVDLEKRRTAHRHMLEIWEQDPPATYLYNLPMFYGKSVSVDWKPTSTPFMDFRAGSLGVATN